MTDTPTPRSDDGELRRVISEAAQSFGTDPITKGSIWQPYIVPEGLMVRLVAALQARDKRREAEARLQTIDAITGMLVFEGIPLDTSQLRSVQQYQAQLAALTPKSTEPKPYICPQCGSDPRGADQHSWYAHTFAGLEGKPYPQDSTAKDLKNQSSNHSRFGQQ